MNWLKKSISLPTALFYGVWTIVGAGIYVMIWKISWIAGMQSMWSLLLAGIFCILTWLSYAELTNRYPKSAWAALYVERWFNNKSMGVLTWILVCLAWVISAWVLAKWFSAYLTTFLPQIPLLWWAIGIVTLFAFLAALGIDLSSKIVSIITVIEISWILFIVWIARSWIFAFADRRQETLPTFTSGEFVSILWWAFLAFYAFIGFEKLATLAEEMQHPRKDLPKAIIGSILISALLYIVISTVALFALDLNLIAWSEKPLAVLYETITGKQAVIISLISLISISNWILVLLIMWSRMLYGMATEWRIPRWFAKTTSGWTNPLASLSVMYVSVLIGILAFPLITLVSYTNLIIFVIFSLVNISLLLLKKNEQQTCERYEHNFHVPAFVPILGMIINILFLGYAIMTLVS